MSDSKPNHPNIEAILKHPLVGIGEHRHSAHEALISGAANACPICLAYKLGSLQGELDKLYFRDGQLAMTLQHVIEIVSNWHTDVMTISRLAPDAVKHLVVDRVIDTKAVEKLLKDVLKQLLPKDEHVESKGSGEVAATSGSA